ncbi:glycoside hydrolase family 15 [Candidatus Peregrinibacteria bacterium CG10_big_fil_rev_8_21_14_0_10_49_10]|nr:MAG: glycoside hydrolase family 15 [Candidatus Peregrinibacteria bacterium CG10_big_fil_rev_8_21_14_0_10_49_10]
MPHSLVIGNGSVLAAFDEHLQMRDLYYPHVGMEDHTAYGDVHRTGVWVEGKGIRWFSHESWDIRPNYKPETLVGHSLLRNEELGIEIIAHDYVHPVRNVLVRNFLVTSIDGTEKTVRVFFHHDLHIYGDKQKDTAFYEPYTNSVVHYRQRRYFLIGGNTSDPVECKAGSHSDVYQSVLHSKEQVEACGISSYSIGKANYQGKEGTWRDAEDGELANSTIEQGSVDSTVGIHCFVKPDVKTEVTMWMCLGKNLEEVVELQQFVLTEGQERLQRNCHNYWKSWVNKTSQNFGSLSPQLTDLYKRSLLLIRLHSDNDGGILAAADADIMEFNRDTYTYVWPRDGAFVSLALDAANYMEVTRRFFAFCCAHQTEDGYMLQKYNPDGSIGSTWHPWFRDGKAQLPIQEDETALIIYAIWKHFQVVQDFEFLQTMFENFVKKAAQFLVNFREEETGLPLPSYDPWEEHRGIFTYTTATTIAGLHAAAQIAHMLGHHNHSERYAIAADGMKQALFFHLFHTETGRFMKKIKRKDGQTTERDLTPDASISVLWKIGVLEPHDPRMVSTMEQLREALTVRTDIGGWARYTHDIYHAQVAPTKEIPGNPWFVTTLWYAQWIIASAEKGEDLEAARDILEWTAKHASPAGILAEQIHPLTGSPLSVGPLTWSHASYVETVLQFVEKESSFSSGT